MDIYALLFTVRNVDNEYKYSWRNMEAQWMETVGLWSVFHWKQQHT